ncbi:MAG TPA: hypothetical protein VM925_19220 [Labilithrix sp.]|nr:hypothetical protein [Labilithrix sp.]
MRGPRFPFVASVVFVLAAACGSSSDRDGEEVGPRGAGDDGTLGSSGGSADGGSSSTCAAATRTGERAAVDIVFVIDTSASMGEETAEVRQNINAFAQAIGNTGLDYNVVMIARKAKASGSGSGICVPEPLAGPGCADGAKFHHLDTAVDSTESLKLILDEFSEYSGWLRPDAYKAFVEVTDDDAALGYEKFDQKLLALSPQHFGDTQKRRYIFNSICGYKRNTAILSKEKCSSAVNIGENYQELSKLTGGTVDSVCETSYASVFDNIAKGLVSKLGCEFAFPTAAAGQQTDPSTVVVRYTPAAGSPRPLTQVTDAAKCGATADAWYYDNPANPAKLLLCPSTCSGLGADTSGKIDIAVGCSAPPPK